MPIDNEPRLYRPGGYDRVGASSTVEALDATPGSRVDVGGFERITRSGRGDRGLGKRAKPPSRASTASRPVTRR